MSQAQKNKNFWKMGKARRKVAIAKDVIASINAATMIPIACNGYCSVHANSDLFEDLQTAVNTVKCTVCGIGGIFVSKVKLGNKCNKKFSSWDNVIYYDKDEIIKNLQRIFTKHELQKIEDYFEGYGRIEDKFSRVIPDDAERLKVIMQNIIDNKGEFLTYQLDDMCE